MKLGVPTVLVLLCLLQSVYCQLPAITGQQLGIFLLGTGLGAAAFGGGSRGGYLPPPPPFLPPYVPPPFIGPFPPPPFFFRPPPFYG